MKKLKPLQVYLTLNKCSIHAMIMTCVNLDSWLHLKVVYFLRGISMDCLKKMLFFPEHLMFDSITKTCFVYGLMTNDSHNILGFGFCFLCFCFLVLGIDPRGGLYP